MDGICAAAILWEKIYYDLGYKNCLPYIPNRFSEGYGLSTESIDNIKESIRENKNLPLLITVDCGIVSVKEIDYAKSLGFKVVICDHHQKGKKAPKADATLWTDRLCGAGISWVLSSRLVLGDVLPDGYVTDSLDLITLATVADVQPLTGYNRALVKHGLTTLNKLERPGLKALAEVSGILGRKIGIFEIGWVLGPRLNASGRLDSALDSLRLLCTKNKVKAKEIAKSLNSINSERQQITLSTFEESKTFYKEGQKIIVSQSASFHEGIIGLVAGKLVNEYYLPSIVISKKGTVSKGSARSVSGVNIIEFLRGFEDFFESLGGHPMAAGFSIRNDKIDLFLKKLRDSSEKDISDVSITPGIKIDCEIKLNDVTFKLLEFIINLEPFGLGNPEPVFLTKKVEVLEARKIGKERNHLRLGVKDVYGVAQDCIAFGFGNAKIRVGDKIDIVYTVSENVWGNRKNIDLKIKDLKPSA